LKSDEHIREFSNLFCPFYLDALRASLEEIYQGRTVIFSDLSYIVTDSRIEDDICQFRFNPQIMDYFSDRLLVGELTQLKTIISVEIIFYDDSDAIVLDNNGNPIQYKSSPHDLGHILDILYRGFIFSYAQCLLRLQPDSSLDFRNIFFHFSHPSSGSEK
jgi:hypothetical protein